MFFSSVLLAALAAVSSAQFTQGPGDPTGNPIATPGLGELIPAGSPYTITWAPTNTEKVSILLLQGPSTNVVPILTIVASTDNTGSYTWNVPNTLAPQTTGYGIEIISEDGSYQYSPQCGVSNSAYTSTSTSTSMGTTTSPTPAPTYLPSNSTANTTTSPTTTSLPHPAYGNTTVVGSNGTTLTPPTSTSTSFFTTHPAATTGLPSATNSKASPSVASTGAAAGNVARLRDMGVLALLGLVGVVVV